MLIKCCECGHDVSEYAQSCPNCGCPVDVSKEQIDAPMKELLEQHEADTECRDSGTSTERPARSITKKYKVAICALVVFVLVCVLALFFNDGGPIRTFWATPTPVPASTPTPTPIPTPKVEHVENMEYSIVLPDVGEREGKYTGETLDGVPDGHGTFETQNAYGEKWSYTGGWKDGEWFGIGICEWESGVIEGGQYSNYYLNGQGEQKNILGQKLSGTYKDGLLNGSGEFSSSTGRSVLFCNFSNGRAQRTSYDIEKQVEMLKKDTSNLRYKEYAKDPKKYQGELVNIVGKIAWIANENQETGLVEGVINVNGRWQDEIYFIYYLSEGEPRLLQNERIELWGILDGLTTPAVISETIPVVLPKVIRERK